MPGSILHGVARLQPAVKGYCGTGVFLLILPNISEKVLTEHIFTPSSGFD